MELSFWQRLTVSFKLRVETKPVEKIFVSTDFGWKALSSEMVIPTQFSPFIPSENFRKPCFLKTSENHTFSDAFREYKKRILGDNGLTESSVFMTFSRNKQFFNLWSKYILFFINNNKGNLKCWLWLVGLWLANFTIYLLEFIFSFLTVNKALRSLEEGGQGQKGVCPQEMFSLNMLFFQCALFKRAPTFSLLFEDKIFVFRGKFATNYLHEDSKAGSNWLEF